MLMISDIMTPEVFTLPADASLEDAAWALAIRGISGAPVRDSQGRLVGTLSKAELCLPQRSGWRDGPGMVKDVMTASLLIARLDEPALAVVATMVRERCKQIVVVDRHDQVVGIVTPTDVLKALVHGDTFEPVYEAENEGQDRAPFEFEGWPAAAQ
jgi:CBS domain-containing membrane protein